MSLYYSPNDGPQTPPAPIKGSRSEPGGLKCECTRYQAQFPHWCRYSPHKQPTDARNINRDHIAAMRRRFDYQWLARSTTRVILILRNARGPPMPITGTSCCCGHELAQHAHASQAATIMGIRLQEPCGCPWY
ncbi:hypothetical protein HaLaN_24311 [Haematococcus lacustris]|uniref:Uncharacterized protein n=1 Tax=Haematococcus lacustris TaxID=44745 RepID=A0A6A0A2Q9_HAELA|nr:hypothetical protein HaLaN_24311 [Haematococcus lacustris]